MIELADYPIFCRNITTIKETSKDNHDGVTLFMTMLEIPVINFDGVKDAYIFGLHLTESPKSNDALCILSDGTYLFIEFKNGYIDKKKVFDIRGKIYDSLLIFSDIINEGISSFRNNMDYILVYNEDRNPEEEQDTSPTEQIQESKSRLEIGIRLSKLGGKNHIRFGLDRFQSFCFRNVFTYTVEEFDQYISSLEIA